jgi:hypothetical protein
MAGASETASNIYSERVKWTCCGATYPRQELVFFTQTALLYVVAVTAIANLTFGNRDDLTLWTSLLASAIGCMSPSPAFRKQKTYKPTLKEPC